MTEALAYVGGGLLVLAAAPQTVELVRRRSAVGLHGGFVILNLAGIALLALRSWEIGERAFLAVNLVTGGFWALALGLKVAESGPMSRRRWGLEESPHAQSYAHPPRPNGDDRALSRSGYARRGGDAGREAAEERGEADARPERLGSHAETGRDDE